MYAVVNLICILSLLYNVVLIPCAFNLLCLTPPISNFSHIDRVIQHDFYKMRAQSRGCAILADDFCISMLIQPFCNPICAHVRIYEFIINQPYKLYFFFIDFKDLPFFAVLVYKLVTIWGKSAVPSAVTGFLPPSGHRLLFDVLTLNLRNCRQHGNHQLSSRACGIYPVFHAQKINAKIFHVL